MVRWGDDVEARGKMARILTVDDQALVRRAVSRVLNRLGHVVDDADNGHTAVRLARDTQYDVALVDYEMAGGPDGLAVLSSLRELQPGCVRVLMTGRSDFPMVVQAINEGEVLRVLPKPFQAEELERMVAEVLEIARRYAALAESQRDAVGAERMFQECIDQNLIKLAVQPIVHADSADVYAVECLLRSQHPILNGPLSVLHAVERARRVAELGEHVNRLAAQWATRLPETVPLFVNVHPFQFNDPRMMERFAPLLPHAGRVVLEITERADLHEIPNWDAAIAQLDGAGFQFAVDDLGAGSSSLVLLAELRPTFIKVDMSIVRNVHAEPRKQRLVDLLVSFANATGARLVAEGVETVDEASALVRCGAHLLQGFYFSRPTLEWPLAS